MSLRYGADLRRSRLVFPSDYNPHTDRSTFLTILTILKSYNSYLANIKYWRKSLRSSILTSSKKLKGTKGYSLRAFSALRLFFRKKNSPKGPPFNFLEFSDRTDVQKSQRVPPFSFFSIVRLFFKKNFSPKVPLLKFLVGAFSFKYVPLFTETDKFTQAKFDQCKLTAKGPPFRCLPFLRNLQNRKTPKGPPFQFLFGTVRIFFENF